MKLTRASGALEGRFITYHEYLVQSFVDALKLPLNTAKQVVYYRLAASKVAESRFFPALAIVGPSGSGKSSIQRGAESMDPDSSHWIACMGITSARVRDELAKGHKKLSILEEFDQVTDLKAACGYVQARCDVNTASLSINRQLTDNGRFVASVVELFGATILHVRDPLVDPALVSRSITLYTRHEDGDFSDPLILPGWYSNALAEIDWDAPITGFRGGRIFDTWRALAQVAAGLGDEEWLEWARQHVNLLQVRLQEAAGYDLRQLILGKIVQILVRREEIHVPIWDRIGVDWEIGQPIRDNLLPHITPWQVADTVRGMGLDTERRGGKLWVEPSEASLLLACEVVGYEDDVWVEELRKRWTMQ